MPTGKYNHYKIRGHKYYGGVSTRFKKGHKGIIGSKNPIWKGDIASYSAIHNWIRKWKGEPKHCEDCGTTKAKKYEWSNIDHKYRRILEDYIRRCTSCHRKYDKEVLKIKIN